MGGLADGFCLTRNSGAADDIRYYDFQAVASRTKAREAGSDNQDLRLKGLVKEQGPFKEKIILQTTSFTQRPLDLYQGNAAKDIISTENPNIDT